MDKRHGKKRWDVIIDVMGTQPKYTAAEIGVEQGKTSKQLLTYMPNLFLFLVDRWEVTPPGDSYFKGSRVMSRWDKNQWQSIYSRMTQNVKVFRGRYEILKMDTIEASKRFENDTLDFVFIDSDHSFAGVCRDIDAWIPKVKMNGIVFFHDYENGNTFSKVREAIEDRLGQNVVTVSPHDHMAYWRKV